MYMSNSYLWKVTSPLSICHLSSSRASRLSWTPSRSCIILVCFCASAAKTRYCTSISRSEVYTKHLFYNTIGVKILTGHIKVSKLWMEFLFKFLMVYKVHVHIFRDDDKKQNMHVTAGLDVLIVENGHGLPFKG